MDNSNNKLVVAEARESAFHEIVGILVLFWLLVVFTGGVGLVALPLLIFLILKSRKKYILTETKIVSVRRDKTTNEMALSEVVSIDSNARNSIFGYGSFTLNLRSSNKWAVEGVKDADAFEQSVRRQVDLVKG